MKAFLCYTVLAALVAVSGTAANANAQSRARVDLEFGGWFIPTPQGLASGGVVGATGWSDGASGFAVQGIVGAATDSDGTRGFQGFELMYRYRWLVGDFEIDYGAGPLVVRGGGGTPRQVNWGLIPTMDVLVGRRLGERIHVKAGAGCFVAAAGDDAAIVSILKVMVVVPLGGS